MILFYHVDVKENDNPDLIVIDHVDFNNDIDLSFEIEKIRTVYKAEPFGGRVALLFALPGDIGHLELYKAMMLGRNDTELLIDDDFPYEGRVKDFVDKNMNTPFISDVIGGAL